MLQTVQRNRMDNALNINESALFYVNVPLYLKKSEHFPCKIRFFKLIKLMFFRP